MSILSNVLARLIQDERYQENPFAKNIAGWWLNNETHSMLSLAEIAKLDQPLFSPEIEIPQHESITDFRFVRICMRGVRRFPSSSQEFPQQDKGTIRNQKIFYGVNFADSENGNAKSKILLGSNGVGKSSVYVCLERIGLGHVYSADFRGYTSKSDQLEYLKHIDASVGDSEILLETKEGIYIDNLKPDQSGIIPYPACFCMENDIESLTKGVEARYIATQIGIQEYYRLILFFKALLRGYDRFKDSFLDTEQESKEAKLTLAIYQSPAFSDNEILKQLRQISHKYDWLAGRNDDDVLRWRTAIIMDIGYTWQIIFGNRPISELLSVVETSYNTIGHSTNSVNLTNSSFSLLEKCLHFLCEAIKNYDSEIAVKRLQDKIESTRKSHDDVLTKAPLCGISDKAYSNFISVQNYLIHNYQITLKAVLDKGKIVFPILMKDYFKSDIKDIRLYLKDQKLEVMVTACDPSTKKILGDVDPRKYLNTFRFKLYCVALKISLAFTCSQLYGINAPIVIDDVFDSSDFSNREMIKSFIAHIYEAHREIFGKTQELQIIFFTQDDVIADSVYRGIANHEGQDKVDYYRIYDYMESEESDAFEFEIQVKDRPLEKIKIKRIDQKIR